MQARHFSPDSQVERIRNFPDCEASLRRVGADKRGGWTKKGWTKVQRGASSEVSPQKRGRRIWIPLKMPTWARIQVWIVDLIFGIGAFPPRSMVWWNMTHFKPIVHWAMTSRGRVGSCTCSWTTQEQNSKKCRLRSGVQKNIALWISMKLYESIWYLIFDMYEILYAMPTIDGWTRNYFSSIRSNRCGGWSKAPQFRDLQDRQTWKAQGAQGTQDQWWLMMGKNTSHQVWSMIVNEFMSMLIVIDHDQ